MSFSQVLYTKKSLFGYPSYQNMPSIPSSDSIKLSKNDEIELEFQQIRTQRIRYEKITKMLDDLKVSSNLKPISCSKEDNTSDQENERNEFASPLEYYKILAVSNDATSQEIKESYKKLCLKLRPDKNQNDSNAIDKFQNLVEAYTILRDPAKRMKYDNGEIHSYSERSDGEWESGDDLLLFHFFFQELFHRYYNEYGSGFFEEDSNEESNSCIENFWNRFQPKNRQNHVTKWAYVSEKMPTKDELQRRTSIPDQLSKPKLVWSEENQTLSLSWGQKKPRKHITHYVVQMRDDTLLVKQSGYKEIFSCEETFMDISASDLIQGHSYSFVVQAANPLGRSVQSDPTTFKVPLKKINDEAKKNAQTKASSQKKPASVKQKQNGSNATLSQETPLKKASQSKEAALEQEGHKLIKQTTYAVSKRDKKCIETTLKNCSLFLKTHSKELSPAVLSELKRVTQEAEKLKKQLEVEAEIEDLKETLSVQIAKCGAIFSSHCQAQSNMSKSLIAAQDEISLLSSLVITITNASRFQELHQIVEKAQTLRDKLDERVSIRNQLDTLQRSTLIEDIPKLEEIIESAKDKGIGIKVAKKNLRILKNKENISNILKNAIQSRDIADLEASIETASKSSNAADFKKEIDECKKVHQSVLKSIQAKNKVIEAKEKQPKVASQNTPHSHSHPNTENNAKSAQPNSVRTSPEKKPKEAVPTRSQKPGDTVNTKKRISSEVEPEVEISSLLPRFSVRLDRPEDYLPPEDDFSPPTYQPHHQKQYQPKVEMVTPSTMYTSDHLQARGYYIQQTTPKSSASERFFPYNNTQTMPFWSQLFGTRNIGCHLYNDLNPFDSANSKFEDDSIIGCNNGTSHMVGDERMSGANSSNDQSFFSNDFMASWPSSSLPSGRSVWGGRMD